MMYLQTIIKRSDDQLTRKFYECQKRMPVKGDWIELVQKDFENAGIEMIEAEIMNQSKDIYKAIIKKIRDKEACFLLNVPRIFAANVFIFQIKLVAVGTPFAFIFLINPYCYLS